jgi:beta-lactamase class A
MTMKASHNKLLIWYINLFAFAVLLHVLIIDTVEPVFSSVHNRSHVATATPMKVATTKAGNNLQQRKQECIPISVSIALAGERSIWSRQATAIFTAPGRAAEIAHIGLHFPLTLLRDPCWAAGTLWYAVAWSTPTGKKNGWIPAATTTFLPSENMTGWASLDVLDPELLTFLAPFGPHVGVSIFDVSHQRHYTYQEHQQFIAASAMKVPIMLAFLDMLEQQGREPGDAELALLTVMIENSDNDAASTLYYNEMNGSASVTQFLQRQGIKGLAPSANAWGYSLITPQAMADLLTLLLQGKILTPAHRALALNLMEQVEQDQRVGVGDTAPAGTTVAMKNGWVVGPDGLWVMNSSGIVMGSKGTYILTIYTQGLSSLEQEQAIAQHIGRSVASLLYS